MWATLATLGASALGAAGDAASNPGAPAMTAPQRTEQHISFGGAHKEAMSTQTALILGASILGAGAVLIYVTANRK